jgi:NAD(P)-dependent dehydrogenase (short-subunit alcohol dehydrogenase family)
MPADRIAGFIEDLQLVKRQGTMQDVANLVAFLCSDEASFITGETVSVSGGFPLIP